MCLATVCLFCSLSAVGQDSIGEDNFVFIDTTKTDSAAVDTAAVEDAEEDAATKDLATRIRDGDLPHATWDEQVPGEWSEEAQSRLTITDASPETMNELRSMKELQYQKKIVAKNTWATRAMAWLMEHVSVLRTILFWLLGILLLAVIVFFIRKNDIPVFRWGRKSPEEEEEIREETGPRNYDELAQAAILAGNFREAVRMRYLQALQTLEGRKLIIRGKDKTNMDYLRELQPTGWHKPFATLTLHYEYVWYGKLPLSHGQFQQLDEKFAAFKHSLS